MAPDEPVSPERPPPSPPPAGPPRWNGWWLASDGRWYPDWMPPGPWPPPYGQRPEVPPTPAPVPYPWPASAPAPQAPPGPTPPGGPVRRPVPVSDPFAPSRTVNRRALAIILCVVAALIAVVVIGSLGTASPASTVTTSTLLTLPPTTQPITTVPQPTLPPYTTVLPAAGSHAGAVVRLKIGRTIRLPPGRNGGIASITVVTFKAPYTPSTANPYVDSPPPPGYEDAVAGVRECTGSAALPAGPSDDLWALVVPAGEIAPYGPDAERPGLQQILYVAPHHCVFGYITFAIAPRSRSLALVYAGSSTAVWLLPQRSNARSIA